MSAVLDIDMIEDAAAFAALASEWWELWRRDPVATPFQSPAWLLPWWRQFGHDGALRVLTLRRDGRLVGLLPLFRHEGRLLPLGAGNSDYLDGVFAPDVPLEAVTALLARGDRLDLPNLAPDARLLAAPCPAGWSDQRFAQEPCPVLALPAVLPKRMMQNLRYYRRRAGDVQFECARPERVPAVLDALFRLHAARWHSRGESGVLADPAVARFHCEAAPALATVGLLRLHALHRDGLPATVLYGFTAKGRAYYYLGGFDPELGALGPGTLVVGHAIDEATREGARSFDFLRGREDYKYRWGAVDRPIFGRRVCKS